MATVSGGQVANELLSDLNAPTNNAGLTRAVSVWLAYESGSNIVGNNPWNITGTGNCGSRDYNGHKFAVYCNLSDGIRATANLLTSRSYYSPIVGALRTANPLAFFSALAISPWSGDHYGGGSKLVSAFNGVTNYEGKQYNLTGGGSNSGLPDSTHTGGGGTDTFDEGGGTATSPLDPIVSAIRFIAIIFVGIAFLIVAGLLASRGGNNGSA